MNCRSATRQIAGLELSDTPGSALSKHIAGGTACRQLYSSLQPLSTLTVIPGVASWSDYARDARPDGGREPLIQGAPDPNLTSRIMDAVREESMPSSPHANAPALTEEMPEGPGKLQLRGWTAGGLVILASLVLIQYSEVVEWLRTYLGPSIDVSLGIILGLGLTIYICVLVGSNLRAVQRLLRLRPR